MCRLEKPWSNRRILTVLMISVLSFGFFLFTSARGSSSNAPDCPEPIPREQTSAMREIRARDIPITPDQFAKLIENGNRSMVETFLAAGMDPNVKIDYERPIHVAVTFQRHRILRLLLSCGVDVNTRTRDGLTPLRRAVLKGTEGMDRVVEILLENGGDPEIGGNRRGWTALHSAAGRGELKLLKTMHRHGADLNTPDSGGNRPLHVAARGNDTEIVRYLLRQGVPVDTENHHSETPLHEAVFSNSIEAGNILINHHADVHDTDIIGNRPIHTAARYGKRAGLKLLLENGANVNATNGANKTPLYLAQTLSKVRFLVNHGADTTIRPDHGNTVLHHAAFTASPEVVTYFIKQGLSLNATNPEGQTPLHLAAYRSDYERRRIVEILVQFGGDVTSTDKKGNRALHYAAREGHLDLVKYLVNHGTKPSVKNQADRTPAQIAEKNGHQSVATFLRKRSP